MTTARSWWLVMVSIVAACRASDPPDPPDPPQIDAASIPAVDAATDGVPEDAPDVAFDAAIDGTVADAAADAALDAAIDAPVDAPVDAPIDVPRVSRFRTVGALAQARSDHAAALLLDGRVLVVGGNTPDPSTAWTTSVELYDPATETFAPAAPTAYAHVAPQATTLPDGRVLVTGAAMTPGGLAPSTEIFDPSSGAWTAGPDALALHRTHVATRLADGRVLITGETTEAYDPITSSFQPLPPLNILGRGHRCARLAGARVILSGGPHQGSSGGGTRVEAEELDPVTSTFSVTGSMATPRAAHTITALADGRALVAGGYIGLGGAVEVHASAELYDPATRTFSTVGAMAISRERHTATLLADGTVLVAGGTSDGTGTAPDNAFFVTEDAAIFSPSGLRFTPTPTPMAIARERHTATRLTDGRVLLVGGSTSPVAELYEP